MNHNVSHPFVFKMIRWVEINEFDIMLRLVVCQYNYYLGSVTRLFQHGQQSRADVMISPPIKVYMCSL